MQVVDFLKLAVMNVVVSTVCFLVQSLCLGLRRSRDLWGGDAALTWVFALTMLVVRNLY